MFAVPFVALASSSRTVPPLSSYLVRSYKDVASVDAAASVAELNKHSTETVFARKVNRRRLEYYFIFCLF